MRAESRIAAATPFADVGLRGGVVATAREPGWFEEMAARRGVALDAPTHPGTRAYCDFLLALTLSAHPAQITAIRGARGCGVAASTRDCSSLSEAQRSATRLRLMHVGQRDCLSGSRRGRSVNWDTSVVAFSEAMTGRVGRGPNPSSSDDATASSGELSFGSIVHVNEKGGSFGGTEEYISLVTSELSRRGVRSHLVCGVLGGTGPLEFDSVHVVDGLAAREPLRQLGPQLVQLIGTLDPDVIYLHNMFDPVAVRAVSAVPNRGPLIWYVHDHYLTCLSELRWRRDHGSCRERLGAGCLVAINEGRCVLRHPERALGADELGRREALSRSLGQADEVIVVSEYMRSLLVEAEPHLAERIHVLPRPIRHPDATRKRQRTRSDEPAVITFAGRITPEKGLAVLIEALGSVRSDSRIELCIAGVVEHHDHWNHCQLLLQRATMANAQLRVSYRGHLDYAATDELFSQSDIVAVPSQWPEPLGAVALEAMSAGATVVASQIGGLDTCLDAGHSGSLVEPSHVTGWARAIEALLHDPGRAGQLAARGQARARTYTVQSHLIALDQAIRRARTHTKVLDLSLRDPPPSTPVDHS